MTLMEVLIEHPLRLWMASVLMLGGSLVLLRGLRREHSAIKLPWSDPRKPFALMGAFRVAIIGLCVGLLGLAWAADQLWLAIIALIVLGEETFESTMALAAMRYTKIHRS
jgi:hypothetical protein